jgi:hypothetical protein
MSIILGIILEKRKEEKRGQVPFLEIHDIIKAW